MIIAIERTDGGISIMSLTEGADVTAELAKWQELHAGEYVGHQEIAASDITADKSERAGWVIKGGKIEIDPIKADPRDYRAKRKEAYIKELGKVPGQGFENAVGDILDMLITQNVAIAQKAVVALTSELADQIAKIAAIKQRFPKG